MHRRLACELSRRGVEARVESRSRREVSTVHVPVDLESRSRSTCTQSSGAAANGIEKFQRGSAIMF